MVSVINQLKSTISNIQRLVKNCCLSRHTVVICGKTQKERYTMRRGYVKRRQIPGIDR